MMDQLDRYDWFRFQRVKIGPCQIVMGFAVLEMVGDSPSRQLDPDLTDERSVSNFGLLKKRTGYHLHQAHVPQMS